MGFGVQRCELIHSKKPQHLEWYICTRVSITLRDPFLRGAQVILSSHCVNVRVFHEDEKTHLKWIPRFPHTSTSEMTHIVGIFFVFWDGDKKHMNQRHVFHQPVGRLFWADFPLHHETLSISSHHSQRRPPKKTTENKVGRKRAVVVPIGIHGTGIFIYIYHTNQPDVGIKIPYMDPIGYLTMWFVERPWNSTSL